MAGEAGPGYDNYLECGRFKIDFQPPLTSQKYCMAVSIDPMKTDIKEVTSGSNMANRVLRAGQTSYGTAQFTFMVDSATHNKDLWDWVNSVRSGAIDQTRATVSVNLFKHDTSTAARTYELHDVFPIEFHQSDYSTESKANECHLKVQIGYVKFAK